MKDASIGKNGFRKGSATLEIMIALSITTVSLSGVVLISSGNQSLSLDARLNNEAINIAQRELESLRSFSNANFNSINSISPSPVEDAAGGLGMYSKELSVHDITQCAKKVISKITWQTRPSKADGVQSEMIITDPKTAQDTGDTCSYISPLGAWTSPTTLISRDLLPAGNQSTGIDVINQIAYMSAGVSGAANQADLFILDVTDARSGTTPPILSSLNVGVGINALDATRDYIYGAKNDLIGQLQIINVADKANPFVEGSASLIGAVGPGSEGKSIFYLNSMVYVGTSKTIGPEFHIFDVSTPSTPIEVGSLEVNHDINKIYVRDNIAYLATSNNSKDLILLDISNPLNISEISSFDAAGNTGSKGLYVIGNKLYLGRANESPSVQNFYILNITNPASIQILGSRDLNLNGSGSEVISIMVNQELAFVGTTDPNDELQIYNISDPTSINRVDSFNYSQRMTGMDIEDGLIYTANRSNDALRIIESN